MANVTKSIVVHGNVMDIYTLWTEFENFPNFMKNIRVVRPSGPDITHWEMQGPLGKTISWDARTTDLSPGRRVAWNSISGDVRQSGVVIFEDLGMNEVKVTATIDFEAPGGAVGEKVVEFLGQLDQRVQEDLENFKHYASTILTGTTRT